MQIKETREEKTNKGKLMQKNCLKIFLKKDISLEIPQLITSHELARYISQPFEPKSHSL